MQIGTGGLVGCHVVMFIPNTVGREECFQRPTTKSTRLGINLDLHARLLLRQGQLWGVSPWRMVPQSRGYTPPGRDVAHYTPSRGSCLDVHFGSLVPGTRVAKTLVTVRHMELSVQYFCSRLYRPRPRWLHGRGAHALAPTGSGVGTGRCPQMLPLACCCTCQTLSSTSRPPQPYSIWKPEGAYR
jgi:hypothetical protein